MRLLLSRDFGAFFAGKLLGALGIWAYAMAAAIIVFNATGSSLAVGAIGIAQFAPQLLLSPLSGKWSDAGHTRAQLLGGRLIGAAAGAVLGGWLLTTEASGWAVAWPVIAASGVVGLGLVLGGPAMQSVVPRLVRPDELRLALTLNTTPMTIGRFLGPAMGAGLAAWVGPQWSILLYAVAQALFILCVLAVRVPLPERADQPEKGSDSVRSAIVFAWRERRILILLLVTTTITFGADPSLTLSPALARDLGGGPELVGALTACFGLGSALGLLVVGTTIRFISVETGTTLGLSALGLGLVTVALSGVPAVSIIGFGIAGLGMSTAFSTSSTSLQQITPAAMRGRIMAFWLMAFTGARPLASAVLGTVTDATGPSVAIGIAAAVLVATAVLTRPRRPRP